MGTVSLAIGLCLILIGFFLILVVLASEMPTQQEWNYALLGVLIVSTPMFIVGALFLKKYDKSKKQLSHQESSSLEILKQRYARGEITKNEFESKKKDLENS